MEVSETNSALEEIEKSKEDVYKIIGQLMIKVSKKKIKEELENKQKLLKMRLDALTKQEESLKVQADKLRDEVMAPMKK